MFLSLLDSPPGGMLHVNDAQMVVRALDFADHKARLCYVLREHYTVVALVEIPAPNEMAAVLTRYIKGELEVLNVLRAATAGELYRRCRAALHPGVHDHD